MAEQRQRGAREVLDDLADLERRLETGDIPPGMRDKAVEARHAMVVTLNSLMPVRDDGLGGVTTHPDMQVGLPLGTANSPLDLVDPLQYTAWLEGKFGPAAAKNFREATREATAHQAAADPQGFSRMPIEEARKLLGIEDYSNIPVETARVLHGIAPPRETKAPVPFAATSPKARPR